MEVILNEIFLYLSQLFFDNGIIIAMGCFITGVIIKNSLTFIDKKYIPLICGVLEGLLGAFVPDFFPETSASIAAINGLALGWAATGGFETFKNLLESAKNKKD